MTDSVGIGVARRALRRFLDLAGSRALQESGEDGPLASRPTFVRYAELMEWIARLPASDPRMQELAMVVDDSTGSFEVASAASMAIAVGYRTPDPLSTTDALLDRLTASLVQDWVEAVTADDGPNGSSSLP